MKWTQAQRRVIESRGRTVLTAAGAGAGKTSCLTERILESIEEGVSLSEMLVVTFTKAAASDIRTKLYDKLTERMAADPENKKLYTQLCLLPSADISTIHSFCFRLIKENFQLLGLSPVVRVADEAEIEVIKAETADRLLDEQYEKAAADFRWFIDAFSTARSDKSISELIIKIYDTIIAYPDPMEFLEQSIEYYSRESAKDTLESFSVTEGAYEQANVLLADYIELAKESIKYSNQFGSEYSEAFTKRLEYACMLKTAESYSALKTMLSITQLPSIKKKGLDAYEAKRLDKYKDSLKSILDKLIALTASYDAEELAYQAELSCKALRVIKELLTRFEELFKAEKEKRSLIDYADQEHYTLSLLVSEGVPTALCKELSAALKQIYIDEYQDVNPLQDRIFQSLSNNNLFMVGDLKQSIYRFRNADPSIFTEYLNSFPHYTDDGQTAGKLYLSENFRSSGNIISFVNLVFEQIYKSGYSDDERLVHAAEGGDGEPVVIVDNENSEQEAEFIAAEIKSIVGRCKKRDGQPLTYGDCAILKRSFSADSPLTAVLRKYSIPYITLQDDGFLNQPEVLLMTALLRCIDNPLDDIALAAALKSPVFGFDEEALYLLRQNTRGLSLYSSLCGESTRKRNARYRVIGKRLTVSYKTVYGRILSRGCNPLGIQARQAREKLGMLRKCADKMSVSELVWFILNSTSMLGFTGQAEKKNLLTLYNFARSFENTSYKGLSPFVEYYRSVYDGYTKQASGKQIPEGGNLVKLMTVHKSKGLDFPVVFLAGASSAPNMSGSRSAYIISRKHGISFRFKDVVNKSDLDTLERKVSSLRSASEQLDEEKRLLYVALTRAKERLYISSSKAPDKNSYRDMISKLEQASPCYVIKTAAESTDGAVVENTAGAENKEWFYAGEDILSFKYPYPLTRRAKVSVSELEALDGVITGAHVSRSMVRTKPGFGKHDVSGAERGTAMHEFMQFADFENVLKNGAAQEAKNLAARRMLTVEQLDLLEPPKLMAFFESELYREIKASKSVFREKRFSMLEPPGYFGKSDGEAVLVQGVIDLFYLNEDGFYTVVDYKTDSFRFNDEEDIIRNHKLQLSYYCRAVEAMTGVKVSRAVVYAFSAGKTIEMPL